jgi:hypothetical protein
LVDEARKVCPVCGESIPWKETRCEKCGAETPLFGISNIDEDVPKEQEAAPPEVANPEIEALKSSSKHAAVSETSMVEDSGKDSLELSWEIDVPLITNRFILYDFLKMFVITSIIMTLLFVGIAIADGDFHALAGLLELGGIVMAILLCLFVFVMVVFFFNRFPMRFTLDKKMVMVESLSTRGKKANRLAILLGLLARRPGVAGAGMLGVSQEAMSFDWDEVYSAIYYPSENVVTLLNNWRVILRLYVPPGEFEKVRELVELGLAKGAEARKRAPLDDGGPSLSHFIKLTAALFLAGFLATAVPVDLSTTLLWALFILALLTIWMPVFSKPFGVVLVALSLAVAFSAVNISLATSQLTTEEDFRAFAKSQGQEIKGPVPEWVLFKHKKYELFDTEEWIRVGLFSIAWLFTLWLGIQAVRGRLHFSGKTDRT